MDGLLGLSKRGQDCRRQHGNRSVRQPPSPLLIADNGKEAATSWTLPNIRTDIARRVHAMGGRRRSCSRETSQPDWKAWRTISKNKVQPQPNPTEKKSKPARDALMAKIMQMLEEQPPPKFLVEIRELRQFRLDQTKGLANACAMLSALPSSWTGW